GMAVRRGRPGPKAAPGDAEQERPALVVSRTEEGAFRTIRDALANARPGDRIEVREADWEEALRLEGPAGRGVVLAGAGPSGPVLWRAPAGHKETEPLLHLSATGLTLRHFTLDGRDRVRPLVTVAGACPGLTLEDVELRGFRASGVRLSGCGGSDDALVLLRRLHLAPGRGAEACLLLEAAPDQACRRVRVRDCRVEGPCPAGVLVAGPVAEVELAGNHFSRLGDGVLCRRVGRQYPVHLSLSGNSFRDLSGAALHFETPPPVEGSRVSLTNNRCVRTAALGRTDCFRPEPPRVTAQWVWAGGEAPARCSFRKTFTL